MADRTEFTHLAWIDLETTGTDPVHDEILEVGVAITDMALNIIETAQWTTYPRAGGKLLRMDDVVIDMHTKSGLLADVLKQRETPVFADTYVNMSLRELLNFYSTDGKIPLAGSGVHFDRQFIERWMPQVNELLTYWQHDVGTVRRALRLAGVSSEERKELTHRALADVVDHIDEYSRYIEMFKVLATPTLTSIGEFMEAKIV